MAFNNNPYQPVAPQSYVNINAPAPNYNSGVFTKFVSSEQEAFSQPNPVNGCSFFVDGENLVLYAKYADGRPMETYDLVLREPPRQPEPLTADSLSALLDKKFDDFENALSKKFVLRKENRGMQNGQ